MEGLRDPNRKATKAVIYAIVDPAEPNHLRYVGQTTNPNERWRSHTVGYRAKYPHDPPDPPVNVFDWCHRIQDEGRTPRMDILATVDRQRAKEVEARWIAAALGCGHDLYNRTPGGERLTCPP